MFFKSTNIRYIIWTFQELNQIETIDPNKLEELERQKYHIISKETESGYKNQKIIFKN